MTASSQKPSGTSRFYDNRYVFAAFFISAAIVLLTFAVRHVYPFGDRTVLRVDLYHQYAPYIEELHSRILRGKSLLYSWEGGLGKNFAAQMAYYTTSPVNLLMFFFPEEHLPEMIALFILLKMSFASMSFTWYLKSRFCRNDLSILVFGLLYGFCAFLTCYYWNIMWLDTVVLFPLVIRGTERLIQEGKIRLYYTALTLTMIVNFYLAVLVCVFTALYCLATLLSVFSWRSQRTLMLQRSGLFAVVSVLCAMTSLFILAPVAVALGETAVSSSSFPSFEIYSNVWQLLTNHFLGARAAVLARNEDLPNIYSGVLTMVLLPLYYFSPGVKRREKVSLSLILVFMLLCSCIRPLDYLIHGMHFPANLPHRFTFVYSFILLYMAYQAYVNLEHTRFVWAPAACIIYTAVILITEFVAVKRIDDIDRVLSGQDIIVNLILMAAYLILLYRIRRRRSPGSETRASSSVPSSPGHKRSAAFLGILLLSYVLVECMYTNISNLEKTGSREAYVKYMKDAPLAVAYMDKQEDGRFYRTEFRRFTTINDASLYHYNGFSQFSSLEPGGIAGFMQALGVAATGNSFRYYDPTPLIDAMFSMKYVMNKDEAHPRAERYAFEKQFGTVWVYRNDRALPLGFLTDPAVLEWDVEDSQPFAVQNDFIHRAAGINKDMFTMVGADDLDTENIDITPLGGEGIHFSYRLTAADDLSRIPSVSVTYTSDQDQYLYLYVDAGNARRFVYKNNSVNEDRELSAGRSMIDVGYVSAGEKIHVEFQLTKRGSFEKTYRESGTVSLYAAGYDDTVLQEAADILSTGGLNISDFEDTRITGTVQADKDRILFTSIPCIKGWNVLLDGQKAEKLSLGNNGVIAVAIPAGAHEVTFFYRERVLIPAVLLSLLGLILFLILSRHISHSSRQCIS